MKTFVLALALTLGLAGVASAQDAIVRVGNPVTIEATHDGAYTAGYRLVMDGQAVLDVPRADAVAGPDTIRFSRESFSAADIGAHTVRVVAYNQHGEETTSETVPFEVRDQIPGAPSGVTISITISVVIK